MVPSCLFLLTDDPLTAVSLGPVLGRHNPNCRVIPVGTAAEIETELGFSNSMRLVAFCSSSIVPAHLLERFRLGSFNFHPGPPNYPGRYPSCWGSYDGVRRFGVTLHRMVARVDEGPIVAVRWFKVRPPVTRTELSDRSFAAAVELFTSYSERLATAPDLPADPRLAWSGRKTRLADYEAMRVISPDLPAAERERRRRAFTDGV
ncbi:MAG: methionyl-tRNA formyltransferase [Alphaproteobacteria bacterium]|nr:methionyl-tRNA formyltransferase [Alphaproteobacteria bacterium]